MAIVDDFADIGNRYHELTDGWIPRPEKSKEIIEIILSPGLTDIISQFVSQFLQDRFGLLDTQLYPVYVALIAPRRR
jgi:hypothetical protein